MGSATRVTGACRDGKVNPFDALAVSYDRMRAIPPPALERIADEVLRCTGATVRTRFFEPGVGTGRIGAPLVRRGYDYTGLDSSAPMLRVLRGRPGGEGWRVLQGDVRTLPFADASFDVVLTAHLLYLVDTWPAALSEIRRVLRPGGTYLHCFEHSSPTPAARMVADTWQAALGEVNADTSWPAATTDGGGATNHTTTDNDTTDHNIVEALRSGNAAVPAAVVQPAVVAARWSRYRSLGEFLDGYGGRLRPLYPAIPDEIFEAVTKDFIDVVRETYPGGATIGHDIRFEIHAARWGRKNA